MHRWELLAIQMFHIWRYLPEFSSPSTRATFVWVCTASVNVLPLSELSWNENSVHKSRRYGVVADKVETNFRLLLFQRAHVHTILIVLIYLIMHDNNDNFCLSVCSAFSALFLENLLNFKSLLSLSCWRIVSKDFCYVCLRTVHLENEINLARDLSK